MLDLDRPDRPLPRDLLASPGGFAWWYADLFDDAGDGLVCIWSYGLPFLPGYLAAHRAGQGVPAGHRPSVNLALYRQGRPAAYTLLEIRPDRARWDGDAWHFGDSTFLLRREGAGVRLDASLVLPVPGSPEPLTGSFHVAGPAAQPHPHAHPDPVHAWTPLLGPATGAWSFRHGDRAIATGSGSGYHDRNGSRLAMDRLGLSHWLWSRVVLRDQLVVTYLNFPDQPGAAPHHVVVTVDPAGHTVRHDDLTLELGREHRGRFGMPWWDRATLHGLGPPLEMDLTRPFDDGPFYLRTWTWTRWGAAASRGIAELCHPSRIDGPLLRPLVQMCVAHEAGPQSLWLPLFSGPREGRLARLGAWWTGRWR